MECPNIDGLKFSQVSIDAIEEIRQKKALGNIAIISIEVGTWANIFVGNGMLEMTYSLGSTDFEDVTYLRVSDYKEKLFWSAVSYGCSIR